MSRSFNENRDFHKQVREYYGKVLQKSGDLRTSACCAIEEVPAHHRAIIAELADEVVARYYGCGSALPPALEGQTVLDLGCGSGRDSFVASKLVGPNGAVIGIDMTDEQLAVARKYRDEHVERLGQSRSNIEFRTGYIEDLAAAGVEDSSVDVVISNCVVNLSPDKPGVLREIFRVLKPGGELYFSDVFSGRRVPDNVKHNPVLYGECLGGALYREDFRRLLAELGCPDFRTVSQRPINVEDPQLSAITGELDFYSITVRAFKLESLEDRCEDYGQVAIYQGSIEHYEHAFDLDDHHRFEAFRPQKVCGNTAAMLQDTRYREHFKVLGDRQRHFGLFDCGSVSETSRLSESRAASSGTLCC